MSLFATDCVQKLNEEQNKFYFTLELVCLPSIQDWTQANWEVDKVEYFRALQAYIPLNAFQNPEARDFQTQN